MIPVDAIVPGAVFRFPTGDRCVIEILDAGEAWAKVRWRNANPRPGRGGGGHTMLLSSFAQNALEMLPRTGKPVTPAPTDRQTREARRQLGVLVGLADQHGLPQAAEFLRSLLFAKTRIVAGTGKRYRNHSATAPRNNTSGVKGIRAYFDSRGVLQFTSTWRYTAPDGTRQTGAASASANEHGHLRALKIVLDSRTQGSGQKMPSPQHAWAQISARLQQQHEEKWERWVVAAASAKSRRR